MSQDSQVELIRGSLKDIENRVVSFYDEIGDLMRLNEKFTKIFAYLQIYGKLTQKQLKQLTNFSSSTISTTLQAFLQAEVVTKKLIPNSRQKAYHLSKDRVTFVYIPFTSIMKYLEMMDERLVEIIAQMNSLQTKHPETHEFLKRRINSLRNYIEAQRRAIYGKKKFAFFNEDTTELLIKIDFNNIAKEFHVFEEKIIELIIRFGLFYGSELIMNKIMGYFVTRGKIDQETLEKLTGFSRSTISRNISQMLEDGRIMINKREFRKSVIYLLNSTSISIGNAILVMDDQIFSWTPKFEELIHELWTKPEFQKDKKNTGFLLERITELLKEIEDFKHGSKLLENTLEELKTFIQK
jgi:DNA-binding transcriptional regulator GbsR (MarR family)